MVLGLPTRPVPQQRGPLHLAPLPIDLLKREPLALLGLGIVPFVIVAVGDHYPRVALREVPVAAAHFGGGDLGDPESVRFDTTQKEVAILIKVPWDRSNERLNLGLELRDADGGAVHVPTPQGTAAVRAQGELEVGRPAGIAPGSPLDASFAMNIPPLPLAPGRYEWHVTVAEQIYSAFFSVRPS